MVVVHHWDMQSHQCQELIDLKEALVPTNSLLLQGHSRLDITWPVIPDQYLQELDTMVIGLEVHQVIT
jgi:hypothetical protein